MVSVLLSFLCQLNIASVHLRRIVRSDWPVGTCAKRDVLTVSCCGRVTPLFPGQVVHGCRSKLAKCVSEPASNTDHDFCFKFGSEFMTHLNPNHELWPGSVNWNTLFPPLSWCLSWCLALQHNDTKTAPFYTKVLYSGLSTLRYSLCLRCPSSGSSHLWVFCAPWVQVR